MTLDGSFQFFPTDYVYLNFWQVKAQCLGNKICKKHIYWKMPWIWLVSSWLLFSVFCGWETELSSNLETVTPSTLGSLLKRCYSRLPTSRLYWGARSVEVLRLHMVVRRLSPYNCQPCNSELGSLISVAVLEHTPKSFGVPSRLLWS